MLVETACRSAPRQLRTTTYIVGDASAGQTSTFVKKLALRHLDSANIEAFVGLKVDKSDKLLGCDLWPGKWTHEKETRHADK